MARSSRELQTRQDFENVVNVPEGRRVLGNILFMCRHGELSLDLKSFENTAFLEGMRYIGLQLETVLGLSATYECLREYERFDKQFNEGDTNGSNSRNTDGTA